MEPVFFVIGVAVPYLLDTTVYKGNGGSFINAVDQIGFFVQADDLPSGASTILHFASGTFVGKLT
jgi:hypothetical protein